MYGTLKKIIAFAGSKEGLLKKSLLFAFLSGLFAALQFAALFIVVEALVSDNRDSRFIWISLGIINVNIKMYKSSKIIMYKFPSFLFLYDPSIDKIFQIL